MCRATASVGWDGVLYDCDFNQHWNTSLPVKTQDVLQMLQGVMCRDTVSVGWDGALYDCDFNQQLALGLGGAQAPRTVFDVSSLQELEVIGHHLGVAVMSILPSCGISGGVGYLIMFADVMVSWSVLLQGRPIGIDNHCFGCTAGSGSGCQGSTS
jgi:Protein of unknown function (DUF3641)